MSGHGNPGYPSGHNQSDEQRTAQEQQNAAYMRQYAQQHQYQQAAYAPQHPPHQQGADSYAAAYQGHQQTPPPPYSGYPYPPQQQHQHQQQQQQQQQGYQQNYRQSHSQPQPAAAPREGPTYRFFQDGAGIHREVIQADIQRYLGPDAFCKPAEQDGVQGYLIAGYRTFTAAQIVDLRNDSANFENEKNNKRRKDPFKYINSDVHRSRQHWGATDQRPQPDQPAPPPTQQPHEYDYTHQPGGSNTGGYSSTDASHIPRRFGGGDNASTSYGNQTTSAGGGYGLTAATASQVTRTSTHFLASDGNWYPHQS